MNMESLKILLGVLVIATVILRLYVHFQRRKYEDMGHKYEKITQMENKSAEDTIIELRRQLAEKNEEVIALKKRLEDS